MTIGTKIGKKQDFPLLFVDILGIIAISTKQQERYYGKVYYGRPLPLRIRGFGR